MVGGRASNHEASPSLTLNSAEAGKKTLIVPDKDADGLTSGAILYRTLVLLGLSPDLISVHLLQKGNNPHDDEERQAMAAEEPSYIVVLDQGSRRAPPLVDRPHKALVIDHHYAEAGDFPEGAQFVSACHSPPVATSSLLTYLLCRDLHPDVAQQCDWLCAMGTHGDLGNAIKWEPPFPDMKDTFKRHTKKAINEAVSLVNAPRRTPGYDVASAWRALLSAPAPAALLTDGGLLAARAAVNAEVERCAHAAPQFTPDGRLAVFRIASAAQVHPVIATRWAGHLASSAKLDIVMVANAGYRPGHVHFSCRVPRCARARDPPVNIIERLRALAAASPSGTLLERLGDSFARGHREASGGVVGTEEFEELMALLRVGEKADKGEGEADGTGRRKEAGGKQKNTLMNYFGRTNA